MAVLNEWFFPRGTLTHDGWESGRGRMTPGWTYTGIHVAALDDDTVGLPAADVERIVVPLAGQLRPVSEEATTTVLDGRDSVFDGPVRRASTPAAGQPLTIAGSGRVAVAEADTALASRAGTSPDTTSRSSCAAPGRDSRQVHNFGTPDSLDAAALLVCEVITPAGNWSSHPAHKHDESLPGHETAA